MRPITLNILAVALAITLAGLGCSAMRKHCAATWGIGVSQARWVGVYQLPVEKEVGVIIADFSKFADLIESTFVFKNETLNLEGQGKLDGEVHGNKVSMIGQVHDSIQGNTSISMKGNIKDEIMEGTFTQRTANSSFTGRFVLVRLTHTTYPGGVRIHRTTRAGQTLIDLGVASEGLLGPGRPHAYGPGIHSDATGRPFAWRTNDGQMVFGKVKENAYGLGVGMDQFGRPVTAKPLW